MRIDEIVKLDDVLSADQYITLLRHLKTKSKNNINVGRIKNNIISSWNSNKRSLSHIESLLNGIDIKLHDIIK